MTGGSIYSKLKSLDSVPMHMPGHKRNTERFPWLIGADMDVTEIEGFDDLNAPAGMFAELNNRLAALRGSRYCRVLVNGSTSGILAAVRTALLRGGSLAMARNCHKSVYNAAELCGASVTYVYPKICGENGFFGSVAPFDVPENAACVVITSPTYEGVVSDIRSIAAKCHERGVPLIVDEAHGAHLGFGAFPESAVSCGADIVIDSLHKTLPSLTQTAAVHLSGDLIDPEELSRQLAIFQSSSPSYILSASIDGCVGFLEREGDAAADEWLRLLGEARERLRGLILEKDEPGVFALDPSKIVFTRTDGLALMAELRKRGIELEMADRAHAIAMTGMGDTGATLGALTRAVSEIDIKRMDRVGEPPVPGRAAMKASEAVRLPKYKVPLAEAVGKISAQYVTPYPPGIPLVVPGEVITPEASAYLRSFCNEIEII